MPRGETARSLARGAFYLAVEKGVGLASGVLYLALLARWLGPTKYGFMTLALAFVGVATMATLNFEVFLERYAAEYETRGMLRTLRRSLLLAVGAKLILGVVATAALIGLGPWLARSFGTPEIEGLIPVLSVMVLVDAFATTGRATLFGVQQYRWVAGLAALLHIAKTVMVGMLWWARRGLPELAVGLVVLTLVQGIAIFAVPLWMLRRAEDRPGAEGPAPRSLARSMVGYCVPLLGSRLTFMSGQNLSKIVIGKLFDATSLGYFSFAFQIIERVVELTSSVSSALLPTLTQLLVRGERQRLGKVFDESARLIQLLACALAFLVFAFARELAIPVGSRLFEPAVPLLRILALVPIFRTAQQPLTMLFQAMRRPVIVLRLAIVKFVAEFGSYFLLLPVAGLAGAGWANLVGAAFAYGSALVAVHALLPAGTPARLQAQARSLGLLLPLLAIAAISDRALGHTAGLALRLALIPVGWVGIFGFGLVTPEDLEAAAAMPLSAAPMRALRDGVVSFVDRFVRGIRPWRLL